MAGLLDMLLGGAPQAAQAATQTAPAPQANPMAVPSFLLANAPANAPVQANSAPPMPAGTPSSDQDVTVTAKPLTSPSDGSVPTKPGAGYNNLDDLKAIQQVQQQYPQPGTNGNRGSGLGLSNMIPDSMPGAGTLRNILGTLGDAFLISSGHQPIHAQQRYNQQIADASAGFDTDPAAAAARIAATGAPGSMQDAQTMMQSAQNADIRKATLQANTDYRNNQLAIRQEQADSLAAQRQQATEGQARSRMGAMLAAGAQAELNGQKGAYKAAQSAASTLGAKYIKDYNPELEPNMQGDVSQYNAGYGMNAGQYGRQQTSNASIQERATAAANRNQVTMRGQDIGAGSNRARVAATYAGQATSLPGQLKALEAKQNSGQTLTPAEQAIWTRGTHVGGGTGANLVLPPGLQPKGPTNGIGSNLAPPHPNGNLSTVPTTQPQTSQHSPINPIHVYPSGRKAQWNGKAWVPLN